SGYAVSGVAGHALIAKPFTADQLAERVREMLTRPSPFVRPRSYTLGPALFIGRTISGQPRATGDQSCLSRSCTMLDAAVIEKDPRRWQRACADPSRLRHRPSGRRYL